MRKRNNSGFSLVEVLLVVALMAVVGTVGIQMLGNVRKDTQEVKLASDISGINRAVDVYLSNGGSFSALMTPQQILEKLKTETALGQQKQLVGFVGSSLDPRLEALMQTGAQAATDEPRAVWSSADQKFEIRLSGVPGVREFALNEAFATAAVTRENRDMSVKYAGTDSWVWDYAEAAIGSSAGPDDVTVTVVTPTPPVINPATAQPLAPPIFSIESTSATFEQFPLFLELGNPNPAGTSVVMYSVNAGPWQQYLGPISVQPDEEVTAFSLSQLPDDWFDSFSISHDYQLDLQNFAGVATGAWVNPEGEATMVQSIANNNGDGGAAEFYYGDAGVAQTNHLLFEGASFDGVMPGSLFELGTLDYYNGSIVAGSGSDAVTLSLELALTTPGVTENLDFTFELESTPNIEGDEAASADFVRMGNITSDFATLLNGVRYSLSLQFGFFGDDGFASVDQFHVHEDAGAAATIYGRFTESPL